MTRVLLLLLLPLVALGNGITFDRYHTQAEIRTYLSSLQSQFPDLVRLDVLGKSQQGREIPHVLLGNDLSGGLPAIYLNGTHHGNEKTSTETSLGVIEYLVRNRDTAEIRELLTKYLFVIQPIVNPDGHAANRREDSKGRDPNRDYEYPGGASAEAFQQPEIRLVRDLLARYRVKAAIAYHAGEEGVLFPWCYAGSEANDKDLFYTVAKKASQSMGFSLYKQSYYDYPTKGEFIDYAYDKYGTIALTYEVSANKSPTASQLNKIVQRGVTGTLQFIRDVARHEFAQLVLEQRPSSRDQFSFNPAFVRAGRRLE